MGATATAFASSQVHQVGRFSLDELFLDKYKNQAPPFGFDGLGEFVYMRTYSRIKENNTKESWHETVQRVVEGVFNLLGRHLKKIGAENEFSQKEITNLAEDMYDRIFNLKFTPPGRGLWAMGTAITEEKHLYGALQNCAFISTENINDDPVRPFLFLMDASMLGVGVGFDTKGAGKIRIKKPSVDTRTFRIPDSREGWVESVGVLLESYFLGKDSVKFDYTKIRPAGSPIKTFGGICTGYKPLKETHEAIREILDSGVGNFLSSTDIVDIFNLIGKCVVSGNVRRSAEIAFGDPRDTEYLNLKNYDKNPHRAQYGWTSNNSIYATTGMDYKPFVDRIADNGEPGFAWLENMQDYSRMRGSPDYKDWRVSGGNPCLEQSLESGELCTLVETYPTNHAEMSDYLKTLRSAFLYAKIVTLGEVHWDESVKIMQRNRRIGTSMSGITQFIHKKGLEELRLWAEHGYIDLKAQDSYLSKRLQVPESIKKTSVKPSGTVSLLAGVTPGVHFPESNFYIRRIRLSKYSALLPPLENAGYHIEPAFGSEDTSVVVEFPVSVNHGMRSHESGVSLWEQLSLAAFMQRYWADNQVSCTVTFDPETEKNQIAPALDYFQYQLKGVSFLPKVNGGAYPQMPYEAITEKEYNDMVADLKRLDFSSVIDHDGAGEKYCSNDVCEI